MTKESHIKPDEIKISENDTMRQIFLSGLNESVTLCSNDPNEDIRYLAEMGIVLLKEIKQISKEEK